MDIEFDFKGDPLGGVISNCEYELFKSGKILGMSDLILMSIICLILAKKYYIWLYQPASEISNIGMLIETLCNV